MSSANTTGGVSEPLPSNPKGTDVYSSNDCRHYFMDPIVQNRLSYEVIDPLSPYDCLPTTVQPAKNSRLNRSNLENNTPSTKFGERVVVAECARASGMTYYNCNTYPAERKPKTFINLLSCISNGCFLQMFSSSEEEPPCPCEGHLSTKIDQVVDEWLHEVPIYASACFDKLIQLINTLKTDLKEHSDNDERIRKDIQKFLGNIPLFVPPEIKDRQQYKDPLINKLLEALKSKVRIRDRFSEIIQAWVYSLPTTDEDVDRYRYAQCLNKCLRGVIANTNPYERKAAIRNFVLCELSKMTLKVDPSQQVKAESELAERLADALAMYRLTPNIQKWISGISIKSKPPIDKERLALDFSDKIRKTIATHEPAQRTAALKSMIHEELSDLPIETEPGVDKNDYINDLINKLLNLLMLDELGKTTQTWIENIPFATGVVADKDKLAYNLAMKLRDEINGSKKIENLKDITRQELYCWPLCVPESRKDEFINIYAKQLVNKINDAGELIDLNDIEKEALEYLRQQPEFAHKTTGEIKRMIKETNMNPGENLSYDEKQKYFSDLKDKLISDYDLWIEIMDEDEKQALEFLKNGDSRFNDLSIGEKKRACKELAQRLRELRTKELPEGKLQKKMEDSAKKFIYDSKDIAVSLSDEEKEALKYLQMHPLYADLNADDVKKFAKRLGNRLKHLKAKGLDPSEIERKMKNAVDDLLNNLIRPQELTKDQALALKILKQREEYENMGDGEIMKAVKELGDKTKNLRDEGLSDDALIAKLNKEVSKWIDVSEKEKEDLSESEKEALKYLKGRPEYENVTYSEMIQGAKQLASKLNKLKGKGIAGDKLDEEMETVVDDWFDDRKDCFDGYDISEMNILKKLRVRPEYAEMGRGEVKRCVKEIKQIVKKLEEQSVKGEELDQEIELEIDNYLNHAKQEMEKLNDVEKKTLRALKDKLEYADLTEEEIHEVIEVISPVIIELQQENFGEEEIEKNLDDEIEYWLSARGPIKTTSNNEKTALEIIQKSSDTEDLSSEEKMRAMDDLGKKVEELKGKGITGKRMQDRLKERNSEWADKRKSVMDSLEDAEHRAIEYLKRRPTFKTITTDQLKNLATKLAAKIKINRSEGKENKRRIQAEANKLLRNLVILEELNEDERKALDFIKKTKDYNNFTRDELKKATKKLGEKYKELKQKDVSGSQLQEKMESETADVMLNVRQERIEQLNDLDDDEKRVLEILKRRPGFSYLSSDEMKKAISALGEKMKDMKSEGISESEIDEKMHKEAFNILKNKGFEQLDKDESKALESEGTLYNQLNEDEKAVFLALKDSPEYQNMTEDMIRDAITMLGQMRRKLREQGKSGADLDAAMSLEIRNFIDKAQDFGQQTEEVKRALELLENSPEFAKMTEEEKTNAIQYLAERIGYLRKQNLSESEYNKEEQEALKNALSKTMTVNVTEWLQQTEVANLKLSHEESIQVFKYMLDNLWKMRKKRKSKDDIEVNMRLIIKDKLESVFQARGQRVQGKNIAHLTDMYFDHFFKEIIDSPFVVPSKNDLVDGFSANIKVWIKKNSELAKLPISSDTKNQISLELAEDLANVRLKSKEDQEVEDEMIEAIKYSLSHNLQDPKKPFSDKQKKKLAAALLADLQVTITDWYIESFSKRESVRPSFSANTERHLSCMMSISSVSSISTGPASEMNLIRAFVNDIRKWMEDTSELASKTYKKKQRNKKFAKNLAKKLYNIEATGTSDLEVYKEMKNEIELSLGIILPTANAKTLTMFSEKLLMTLMETIDRVESSTSATTSEASLVSC